jgi:hypothetical protein
MRRNFDATLNEMAAIVDGTHDWYGPSVAFLSRVRFSVQRTGNAGSVSAVKSRLDMFGDDAPIQSSQNEHICASEGFQCRYLQFNVPKIPLDG